MEFYDVHTHQIYKEEKDDYYQSCIYDVYPLEFEVEKDLYEHHAFSCGIHPWYSEDSKTQMDYLREIAANSRIVAIGETGLDKLKGPSFDMQIPVFKEHIVLSENIKKPVIIHCVKAWDELIKVKRELKPSQLWIIHGYRGKPGLTKMLVREGFYFSVGENINIDSMQFIPINRMFCETDAGEMNIKDIYIQASHALNIDKIEFVENISENVKRVFPTIKPPRPFISNDHDENEN